MNAVAFSDPAVKAVFDGFPLSIHSTLLATRALICDTAKNTKNAGIVQETLKWGQPSYHTEQPKSGSPIRLGVLSAIRPEAALFVHCQTSLIEDFKALYHDVFEFEGKRAVLLPEKSTFDKDALRHCILLALTYHQRATSAT